MIDCKINKELEVGTHISFNYGTSLVDGYIREKTQMDRGDIGFLIGWVMKLVYMADLKSAGHNVRVGSTPIPTTMSKICLTGLTVETTFPQFLVSCTRRIYKEIEIRRRLSFVT